MQPSFIFRRGYHRPEEKSEGFSLPNLVGCKAGICTVTPLETGRPGAHAEAFLSLPGPMWVLVLPQGLPGSKPDVDLGPRPWTYVW